MGLLIRYSREDTSLRSVGDAPNGVLAVAQPERQGPYTWVVDSAYLPPVGAVAMNEVGIEPIQVTELPASSTIVELDDVIDGCESGDELLSIFRGAALAVLLAAQQNLTNQELPADIERIRAATDFLEAHRDGFARRGLIGVVE